MRAIYTIAEREFRGLLTSPIGYVVMTCFLVVAGFFFVAPLAANVATIRYVVGNTVIWLIFLVPAITMRLISEEKKQGTIELLMTSPVTEAEVVLGKFFGAMAYYCVILFSLLPFVFVLGMVRKGGNTHIFPTYVGLLLTAVTLVALAISSLQESRVLGWVTLGLAAATIISAGFAAKDMGEWGPTLTAFLGLLMIGAVFIAIGLLASTLTRNQIISWVVTAAALLVLTVLVSWLTNLLPSAAPSLEASPNFGSYLGYGFSWIFYEFGQVLQGLNLQAGLQSFAQGVLDLRDFVLYFSLIGASLFFAIRGLHSSRWA